jgi:hypothetical protein
MHLKKLFAVALTLFATIALMAGTAQAQVSQARVVQTIPGPVADHVTSDILIDFAGSKSSVLCARCGSRV